MAPQPASARERLYLQARAIVAEHYRRELTLGLVAEALASSPRTVQRAYSESGELTFAEDLMGRRMAAAAQLLSEQRSVSVESVARLVGYRHGSHFTRAFARRYGLSPGRFRTRLQQAGRPGAAV